MSGLIYKEWYSAKKRLAPFVILAGMLALLGILVFISVEHGNLKTMVQGNPLLMKTYSGIFYYLPIFLLLTGVEVFVQNIFTDYDTGWMNLSYTFPVTPAKSILAKYMMVLIYSIACFLTGILYSLVIGILSGVDYSFKVLKLQVIILLITVLLFSVVLPIAIRVKKKNKMDSVLGILFTVFAAIFIGFMFLNKDIFIDGTDETESVVEPFVQLKDRYPFFFSIPKVVWILAAFVIIISGYIAATKIYRRRDK